MMIKECKLLIIENTFAYGTSKEVIDKNQRVNKQKIQKKYQK